MAETKLPLSGIVVLDLTRVRSGPTAVRQLADYGADVIKIEEPDAKDSENSAFDRRQGSDFQNLQRNKRSITLNLKAPDGLAIFKRLVEKADVVVENYRPGVKHRLGIDYESLRKINPRLIYASISGFGQEGPYRDRPGIDQVVQGMGGLMSITGLPGQGPVRAGIAVTDLSAGLFLSYGIVLALFERERSGEGQWVQTSLLQAMIAMLDFQATRWLVEKEIPPQAGNRHPTGIPTDAFKTADGVINIAASGDLYPRLCHAIGMPELITHPDYCDFKVRSKNRDALHKVIGERLLTRGSAEWIEALNKAGVACGPIYNVKQVFDDPHVRTLNMVQPVDHPKLGRLNLVGQGVTLTRTPPRVRVAAPDRGQHTREVLEEFGVETGNLQDLRQRGII
ncbi:MAG TPA: CoA transferase [Burkholderiales bacterium]|jgi:formyl-CoA transferase|nr:CoA transferase [Burkholderiales bacterium]